MYMVGILNLLAVLVRVFPWLALPDTGEIFHREWKWRMIMFWTKPP